MRKIIFALVFGLAFFLCSICAAYSPHGELYVTMLDIGQGDAFLIETPTQNILLDTGDVSARKILVEKLHAKKIKRLEKIILTHPHADHIGGVQTVLKDFAVDEILDNGFASSNPLYKKYRAADVKFSTLRAGNVLDLGNGVYFEVLAPVADNQFANVNNQSIVGRLVFEEVSMLFTGDAEKSLEKELLQNDLQDIQATVLKAGHHGSKTSSSLKFVRTIKPEYVLISAGLGNDYGHPHKKTLETFLKVVPSDNIFCTAFNGDIFIETDGEECEVSPEILFDWVNAYLEEK